MMHGIARVLWKKMRLFGFAITSVMLTIICANFAEASKTCDQLINPRFEIPSSPNRIPLILQEMQSLGGTEVVSTKKCSAFAGACGLAAITVGVEALERFFGASPTRNEILSSEAMSRMELLKSVTGRSGNGMHFAEMAGYLRFSLEARSLDRKVALRSESVQEFQDLALAPNEMLLLLTMAGKEGHVVLLLEQRGTRIRAYDPNTSRIEEYQLAMTPSSRVRLVSVSNPVGFSSVLDILHSFRLSPDPVKNNAFKKGNPLLDDLEQTSVNLSRLLWIMENPGTIDPNHDRSPFQNRAESSQTISILLASYQEAQKMLPIELSRIANFDEASAVFHIKLLTKEIERREAANGFFNYFRSRGFLEKPASDLKIPTENLPKWDPKLLEARASIEFKSRRTLELQNLERLMAKTLTRDDLIVAIPRAFDAYYELVTLAFQEVQALDAHRLATEYYRSLVVFSNSPQFVSISSSQTHRVFVDSIKSKLETIQSARKQFSLDRSAATYYLL